MKVSGASPAPPVRPIQQAPQTGQVTRLDADSGAAAPAAAPKPVEGNPGARSTVVKYA